MFEYTPILVYVIFGLVLSAVLLIASYFLAIQKGNLEKFSPYECGFQPFQDARQEFDVRFYVVAILFLIFDLEVLTAMNFLRSFITSVFDRLVG